MPAGSGRDYIGLLFSCPGRHDDIDHGLNHLRPNELRHVIRQGGGTEADRARRRKLVLCANLGRLAQPLQPLEDRMSTSEPSTHAPSLEEQVAVPQGAALPGAKADGPGRTGEHDDARIQQRADDDHQLRQDGPAPPATRRRATRPSKRSWPPACGPPRSPTASWASPAIGRRAWSRPTWSSWSKTRCCCWNAR